MRIPEKPPNQKDIRKMFHEEFSFDEFKPYLDLINANYFHWDEIPKDNRFKGLDLKLLWAIVKLSRNINFKTIKFKDYVLQYNQTPTIEKTLHDLDVRIGGKIDFGVANLSPNLQNKYLINSLREEAIASSQLEGAVTTRIVAKEFLRENKKPRSHSDQMILNNYLTMRYIRECPEQNSNLTLDFIKSIHKQITRNTLKKIEYEGSFRKDNEVKVFSIDDPFQVIHIPPDFNEMEELLQQVCDFINNETEKYYFHPFIKAIILHYMIGYIHPFNDGNGRTARALFYWYLLKQHYDFFEYIAISTAIKKAPAKYIRAYLYTETDDNDITYFVKFNLKKLDEAINSFETYVNKTKTENQKLYDTIKTNTNLNLRQADILIEINKTGKPITIKEIKERYHISYQTARTDLLDLSKYGYLEYLKAKQFIFRLNKNKSIQDEK